MTDVEFNTPDKIKTKFNDYINYYKNLKEQYLFKQKEIVELGKELEKKIKLLEEKKNKLKEYRDLIKSDINNKNNLKAKQNNLQEKINEQNKMMTESKVNYGKIINKLKNPINPNNHINTITNNAIPIKKKPPSKIKRLLKKLSKKKK